MHHFACKLEVRAPFCLPFELSCIVLRVVSNTVHRFACRIRKVCTILRATLEERTHRFVCQLEVHAPFCMQFEFMCIVLRAVSNIVHHFACRVRKVCTVLRATLEERAHHFACQLEIRAPFYVQVGLVCTVLLAISKVVHHFSCRVKMACIILRAILKEDMQRFACHQRCVHHFACRLS